MKTKAFFLSILLAMIFATGAYAQGFQLGIKGGTNIYKITNESFDQQFRYGYSIGGFAVLNFTKHIGIQPEVLWNEARTQTGSEFNVVYQGASFENITLNYLSIPVLLNITPAKILTFQIGPQFGILVNQNDNLFANGKNAFKKGDFSMIGGAQLNLAWLKIGARYFVGLSNLNDLPQQAKWNNQGFQLYLGIRII